MKEQIEKLIIEYKETVVVLSYHLSYYERCNMDTQAEMEKLRIMTYEKIIHELETCVSSDSTAAG